MARLASRNQRSRFGRFLILLYRETTPIWVYSAIISDRPPKNILKMTVANCPKWYLIMHSAREANMPETPEVARLSAAIKGMNPQEQQAFSIVIDCLICPIYGKCHVARLHLRSPLMRAARDLLVARQELEVCFADPLESRPQMLDESPRHLRLVS